MRQLMHEVPVLTLRKHMAMPSACYRDWGAALTSLAPINNGVGVTFSFANHGAHGHAKCEGSVHMAMPSAM